MARHAMARENTYVAGDWGDLNPTFSVKSEFLLPEEMTSISGNSYY